MYYCGDCGQTCHPVEVDPEVLSSDCCDGDVFADEALTIHADAYEWAEQGRVAEAEHRRDCEMGR